MAGLDPAIHVLLRGENCVDARIKSGHDDSRESPATTKRLEIAGIAEIGFVAREGRTRLRHLYQHDPLRVLFPDPPAGENPIAVLLTTSGGLVGGDRLTITVDIGAGAAAHVTAQAAEKIYRSSGPDCALED